ncbi:MAG: phosphoribosylanthranilate isomerase [Ignavibacteria bacterium]
MTKVKICCISSEAEAETALNMGASAIGLVGKMPSGPGVIADDLIKDIAAKFKGRIETFLLTSETTAEGIFSNHSKAGTDTVQIVDRIDFNEYDKLRGLMPGVRLVQVVHVIDANSVIEALMYAKYADALLLDSGNPSAGTKILGGTGKVHDRSLSKEIVQKSGVPVYLAGGLNPDNVREAIENVNPYAVDVCSGVRTNGNLDADKLKSFVSRLI